MPQDMRDDMAAAFADLSKGDDGGQETTGSPSAIGGEEHDFRQEVAVFDATTGKEITPSSERARSDDGRYTPKTPAQGQVPADKEPAKEGKVTSPAPKPAESRAPVSWKPEEREHWSTIKPEVQATIARRELEVQQVLSATTEARKTSDEFHRITQPYEAMFRAENATAMQAVDAVLKTAAALRVAPPGHKASLIAEMIVNFGIPLDLLDKTLSAKLQQQRPPSAEVDPLVGLLDNKLKPMLDFMEQFKQGQQAQTAKTQEELSAEWTKFASENEFAADVQMDIAALLEAYSNQGRKISLQDAYRMATMAHPTISELVRKREQANGSAQQTAAARRALEAAASIPSNGGAPSQGGEEEGDGSLRSAILASMKEVANRR